MMTLGCAVRCGAVHAEGSCDHDHITVPAVENVLRHAPDAGAGATIATATWPVSGSRVKTSLDPRKKLPNKAAGITSADVTTTATCFTGEGIGTCMAIERRLRSERASHKGDYQSLALPLKPDASRLIRLRLTMGC